MNRRVTSVVSHSSSLFSIGFKDVDYFLYIDLSSNNSFVYPFKKKLNSVKREDVPFFVFLKRRLVGLRLIEIEQNFSERVGRFVFEDVRGKIVNRFELVLEVMDRNTNAIFVNERKVILQAYKYLDSRGIYPKKVYSQPNINMPDILKDNVDLLVKRFTHKEDILGFNSRLRKCINDEEKFVKFVEKTRYAFESLKFELCLYCRDVYPICPFDSLVKVDDEHLFDVFILKPKRLEFENRKNSLLKVFNRRLKSLYKRMKKVEVELFNAENFEIYKIYAENLMANPTIDIRYRDFVEVDDVYSSKKLRIPLNPKIDLFENAQNYFKRYKKLKNSVKLIKKRINQTKMDIEFLNQLIFDVENANSYEELEEVRNIAIAEGIIKRHIKPKGSPYKPYEHLHICGFDAYIGKNARGNDIVALKLSSKNDLWFHARSRPSAHLVLKLPSKLKDVPESVKIKAAEEVACKSKAMIGEKVEIDYTKVKNLKKPKGCRVGMVLYTNFKTLTVEKGECS